MTTIRPVGRFYALIAIVGFGAMMLGLASHRQAGPTRVAIVDLDALRAGLTESKDLGTRLDQIRADARKKLDEINNKLTRIDKDLEGLSKDAPAYRQLLGEKLEWTATGRAREAVLQQLIDEEMGSSYRALFLKITDAVKEVAARDGWDVVLRDDRSTTPPEKMRDNNGNQHPITAQEVIRVIDQRSVLAASQAVDITRAVMDQMNNQYAAAKH